MLTGGKPTDWTAFWDSFESSIHGNDDISDVSKFIYLSSLLEGPAAYAIAGLQQTSVNYSEAIAILKKRFGNKQLIISKTYGSVDQCGASFNTS